MVLNGLPINVFEINRDDDVGSTRRRRLRLRIHRSTVRVTRNDLLPATTPLDPHPQNASPSSLISNT